MYKHRFFSNMIHKNIIMIIEFVSSINNYYSYDKMIMHEKARERTSIVPIYHFIHGIFQLYNVLDLTSSKESKMHFLIQSNLHNLSVLLFNKMYKKRRIEIFR